MIYLSNKKKIKKNISGFTLVEVLVAVFLFTVIILGTTQIFFKIMDSQEVVSQENYVQSDIEYFLKILSNNVREAEISENQCSIPAGTFYLLENSASKINLIKDGICYSFAYSSVDGNGGIYFLNDALASSKLITSAKTNILSLTFIVDDDINNKQPKVSVLVKAAPKSNSEDIMYVQKTVSLNSEY
jgi:prepilin-type N-terminal cleavage/methylation domain-containing protein